MMDAYRNGKGAEQPSPAPDDKKLEKTLLAHMITFPESYAQYLLTLPEELFWAFKGTFIKVREAYKEQGKKGIMKLAEKDNTVLELMKYMLPYEMSEAEFTRTLDDLKDLRANLHAQRLFEDLMKGNKTIDEVIEGLQKYKLYLEAPTTKITINDIFDELHFDNLNPAFKLSFFGVNVYHGDVILITASTGSGKTTTAINIVMQLLKSEEETADNGYFKPTKKALYFTYEMTIEELLARFTANYLNNKSWEEVTEEDIQKFRKVYGNNLGIHEYKDIEEVTSYVWLFHPDVFAVDYDQLVTTRGKFESEERRLAYIVRSLKKVALATQSVCILLSQINDKGEARYSREKVHAASIHINLERKEDNSDIITYHIKKNRYGKTGEGKLHVEWETVKIKIDNTPTFKGV